MADASDTATPLKGEHAPPRNTSLLRLVGFSIGIPMLLCTGLCGGCYLLNKELIDKAFVASMLRAETVESLKTNPVVVDLIGKEVVEGSTDMSLDGEKFKDRFTITGPDGRADVTLDFDLSGEEVVRSRFEVVFKECADGRHYKEAVGELTSHAGVIAALDQPVEAGKPSIKLVNETLEYRFAINGPQGKAEVTLDIDTSAEAAKRTKFEVSLPDESKIDLLNAAEDE